MPGPLRRLLTTSRSRPPAPDGLCDELRQQDGPDPAPTSPQGCEECLAQGTSWVHLRLCLGCGHVGCCDSGQYRHARAHADAEGHPVMRSFEPGESWRWCFAHELLG